MNPFVSLDTETMATTADTVILSIGAAYVENGKIASRFYTAVDTGGQQALYLRRVDYNTMRWWAKQPEEARKAAFEDPKRKTFEDALMEFKAWFPEGAEVWSKGASFDIPILEHAYCQLGVKAPWAYYASRCLRTIAALYPGVCAPAHKGAQHNALVDAEQQAEHLIALLEAHDRAQFQA